MEEKEDNTIKEMMWLARYRDIARRAVKAYTRKDFMQLASVAEELKQTVEEDQG